MRLRVGLTSDVSSGLLGGGESPRSRHKPSGRRSLGLAERPVGSGAQGGGGGGGGGGGADCGLRSRQPPSGRSCRLPGRPSPPEELQEACAGEPPEVARGGAADATDSADGGGEFTGHAAATKGRQGWRSTGLAVVTGFAAAGLAAAAHRRSCAGARAGGGAASAAGPREGVGRDLGERAEVEAEAEAEAAGEAAAWACARHSRHA